jgi:hypothetical protein
VHIGHHQAICGRMAADWSGVVLTKPELEVAAKPVKANIVNHPQVGAVSSCHQLSQGNGLHGGGVWCVAMILVMPVRALHSGCLIACSARRAKVERRAGEVERLHRAIESTSTTSHGHVESWSSRGWLSYTSMVSFTGCATAVE